MSYIFKNKRGKNLIDNSQYNNTLLKRVSLGGSAGSYDDSGILEVDGINQKVSEVINLTGSYVDQSTLVIYPSANIDLTSDGFNWNNGNNTYNTIAIFITK